MATSRAGWCVGHRGSCRHHCRHCCWWRCGRSGGDREAVRGVGARAHDGGGAAHHILGGGHCRRGHRHQGQGLL